MNDSQLPARRIWLLSFLPLAGLAAAISLALHFGCGPSPTAPVVLDSKPLNEEQTGPTLFEDVTASTGVAFTYQNGQEAGHLAILESLGGGGALIDFDGDGLLDLFLCGGGYYDGPDKAKPLEMKEIKGHPCKLYKNLGNFKFVDVTKEAGLDGDWFYTHGAAVADYDNDGWPDLLVTGWHELRLYHNEPVDPKDPSKGRKFVDRTKEAKLPKDLWTTSAAWADFDGDGFVDFYVCQYTDWSFENHPRCTYDTVKSDVCPPKQFNALPHHVFRNNGDGTFTDVSNEAGLRMRRSEEDYKKLTHLSEVDIANLKRADAAKEYGKGLGVLAVDINNDGKPDVYVANDTVDNFLYVNVSEKGKIRFREVGLASGTARDDRGSANGSMGVDAADYDRCGRPSLWVTNYENELHALYHNDCTPPSKTLFQFATQRSGIAALGQSYVGFGTVFIDMENRGWEDIFISNGHAIRFPTGKAPRAQKPVLLRNVGDGKFKVMTKRGGSYAEAVHVGRGLLAGDLDNDGRTDVILCHLNEPASILRNIAGTENHWLGLELAGSDNRSVVGTKLTLEAGGQKQTRYAKGGASYLSACDQRHVFGLGAAVTIDKLTITWPSGQEQAFADLKTDRYWRITEGKKEVQEPRGAAAK
jgi:enediyne biosynthesis protein E4